MEYKMKQNIIKLACAIAAALLFFITLPTAYKYNQYKRDFLRAVVKVNNEKYDEAIKSFNDLMKTDLGKKNTDKIKKEIDKATSFKENKALYEQGLSQFNDKRYLEAIDIFKKIPKDDAKRYEMTKGKIDESKSLYTSLYIENAKIMAKQYHFDEATKLLDLVLKTDETNKEASTLKGEYAKSKEAAEVSAKEIGYQFDVVGDSIRLIRCLDYGTEVTVPEQIDGKSVRIIGKDAFTRFYELKSFSIPQGITTIEDGAFFRCYSIENIKIPKNVEQIGENPFYRCVSLTKIMVDPENKYYKDIEGVLYNKDITELLVYPEGKTDESYTIPSTVKKIAPSAFGYGCPKLKTITIPSSVGGFPDDEMFNPAYAHDITFKVKEGSAAETYLKNFQLKYENY